MMKKVELLAPARNFKAIKAASKHTDSIYFGIKELNMRMRSENIAIADLGKIVDYCEKNELKTYITTNILIYDSELRQLRNVINEAKESGIDAVIVHDLAAIQIAKEMDMPFHVSTQCNISNSLTARFYESLGASRLILARELSLEKIKEIKRNLATAEIEVFIHGAMCASISGRCYFSQDICGTEEKSANRGNCVQPCRRRWWLKEESGTEYIYDGVRFMNSRDLCTIAHVPDLIEAKIDAFKIEGRMRHPHYVETVSRVYREAIEAYYKEEFTQKKVGRWVTDLKRVYNRGFTPGFLFKRMTEEDHQHNYPANLSHYRYIKVGHIREYDEATHQARILLNNGYLWKNADIIIMGKSTDTYVHEKLDKLVYNGNEVKKTPSANKETKIEVDIEIPESVIPEKDNVYVFTNRTYKTKKFSLS